MRLSLAFLVLCLSLPAALVQAQDDELEGWQKRILRALEEAQDQGRELDREGDDDDDATRPDASMRQGYVRPQPDDRGAARAAEEARRRYGGRALAVVRVGDAYRVRLLLDSGRVMTVTIAD